MTTTSGEYPLTIADLLLYFFGRAAFYCGQSLLLLDEVAKRGSSAVCK